MWAHVLRPVYQVPEWSMPQQLADLVPGIKQAPFLVDRNTWWDFTGYPNAIATDMTTSVMRGFNFSSRRSYVTIRYKGRVLVLFQRYSNDTETWSHAEKGYTGVDLGSCHFRRRTSWHDRTPYTVNAEAVANLPAFVLLAQQGMAPSWALP